MPDTADKKDVPVTHAPAPEPLKGHEIDAQLGVIGSSGDAVIQVMNNFNKFVGKPALMQTRLQDIRRYVERIVAANQLLRVDRQSKKVARAALALPAAAPFGGQVQVPGLSPIGASGASGAVAEAAPAGANGPTGASGPLEEEAPMGATGPTGMGGPTGAEADPPAAATGGLEAGSI